MQNSSFVRLGWLSLFVIYLVILAGSVVRMTGSGMGCPDWPKCFGYLIPPTEEAQVVFQPNTTYKKGQMIVVGDTLYKSIEPFSSSKTFDENNWEAYEKHDYATFNVTHTWIEYINRLLGALSGLFMLALFIYGFFLAIKKRIPWVVVLLTFFGVNLLGFQAWLGKTVVDSNLAGAKITAHLFGALALVAVILLIIRLASRTIKKSYSKQIKVYTIIAFVFFMVQLFFGTEVRQLVDELYPQSLLGQVFESNTFKIHRSFSWLVLLTTGFLLFKAKQKNQWSTAFSILGICMALEFALGLSLYFYELPKFAQPLHLLFANILFACYVWVIITPKKSTKT